MQARIDRAIDKGVGYLKAIRPDTNGKINGDGDDIGMTALVAWTCLESGVPGDSPDLAGLVDAVRHRSLDLQNTYSLSVAIMLFDRLGDPGDEFLIQTMALRLLGGQRVGGGWSYPCTKPDDAEVKQLKKLLDEARQLRGKGEIGPAKSRTMVERKPTAEMIKRVKAIARNYEGGGDNSNTQFAMLALWVARRHGVPVDDALTRVAQRFRETQGSGGTWAYSINPPSATMTCAGLLGLALGHGVTKKTDKGAADLNNDPKVKAGLRALDDMVKDSKTGTDILYMPNRDPKFVYYFLFSLERMAVVYNVKKIGGKDWYAWGAKNLVDWQGPGGNWLGNFGLADTCFALLFLKRANVAQDLTLDLLGLNPIEKPKAKSSKKAPPDPFGEFPKLIEKKKPAPPKKLDSGANGQNQRQSENYLRFAALVVGSPPNYSREDYLIDVPIATFYRINSFLIYPVDRLS